MRSCGVQLFHLQHLEYSITDRERWTVEELRWNSEQAHKYFHAVSELKARVSRHEPPDLCIPWLAAHACSVMSLIVASSRALQEEIDGKVANLPAIALHKSIGSARLALVGITDWHRQLHRISRHSSSVHTGTGELGRSTGGQHAVVLHDACAAMVKGMDRLTLHACYMRGLSFLVRERSVRAIVTPHGPLSKDEGLLVDDLLLFFMHEPKRMFHDCLDACGSGNEIAGLTTVRLLLHGSYQRWENERNIEVCCSGESSVPRVDLVSDQHPCLGRAETRMVVWVYSLHLNRCKMVYLSTPCNAATKV